ncbi:hypothetical protein [Paenibacillus terrae]|uniref:Uncharacterized protein n=1 Tax=Paenibacillus terrae TaxID=159743 RepID=A0A0D7WUZ6_9BACL|nr:hypothetical protein [Paenibacillus terrae]KJD42543.1 hypothetical protein QD47_27545 [Paenibacillus terrae]TKH43415.1 hypothetical protein C1I60_14045 [Paenibacillus terrae]
MNNVQKNYMVEKAAYDAAKENEDWELVERLEIPYLEAESEMVEWALDHADKSNMIPPELILTLRDKWMFPQYHERMVDLAFRLSV